MFASFGVLQRDAPSQAENPEFLRMQRQMASDMATAVRRFNAIAEHDLKEHFTGYNVTGSWPSTEQIKEALQEKIQETEAHIRQQEAKRDQLQQLFDETVSQLIQTAE